ncbi:MAG: acetolactate decarboxylase [Candidatus Sumerlaeia bacterium]|nr:acetolactate decarboxylase [Candidatus Sumerlaeia bacterium]
MRRCVVGLGLIAAVLAGCAHHPAQRDTIYCVATVHSLIEGLFDGEVTCGELRRHGNIGLGTVNGLDGELIVLDGVCYLAKGDGTVVRVPDSVCTPYALVTPFEADVTASFTEEMDYDQMKARLDQICSNPNLPYAFRIEGTFSYLKARSVPPQSEPYPRLIEVIRRQIVFEFKDVEGVLVGFRLPTYFDSLGAPGWHLHFLASDQRGGGHLVEFRAKNIRAAADLSPNVFVALPQSEKFAKTDFSVRKQDEVDFIMGRTKKK